MHRGGGVGAVHINRKCKWNNCMKGWGGGCGQRVKRNGVRSKHLKEKQIRAAGGGNACLYTHTYIDIDTHIHLDTYSHTYSHTHTHTNRPLDTHM